MQKQSLTTSHKQTYAQTVSKQQLAWIGQSTYLIN